MYKNALWILQFHARHWRNKTQSTTHSRTTADIGCDIYIYLFIYIYIYIYLPIYLFTLLSGDRGSTVVKVLFYK